MAAEDRARPAPATLLRAGTLVARRVRALPRAAREERRPVLARVGRALPGSRSEGAPGSAGGARARDPLLLVPAVGRGRAVVAGAGRVRHRRLRGFSVHGERRQRRRLVEAGRLPLRRVGGRAAGRLLRDRTGLGLPGVSLARYRRRGIPVARRARAAERGALR